MCQDIYLTYWTDPGHGGLEVSQEVLDLIVWFFTNDVFLTITVTN